MYTLLRLVPARRLLLEQLPAFAIAFIVAEVFYKFRSFALETAAFLATWLVLDAVIQLAARALAPAARRADTRA
jgi:hypothetical protein